VDVVSEARLAQGEEVFGSPAASNGRIFLPTIEALYCIGGAKAAASKPSVTAISREAALTDRKVAQVLLTPTEQILKPGEKLQLRVLGYNKAGQLLGPVKGAVVTAEGGGAVSADLVYAAPASGVSGVVLTARAGELSAKA
ncbi:MAG: hypothetical protein ACKON9_00455, partial [Planctomycetaceae bacterium]